MNDHIVKALCNTLMHSLWQGILLAVITGAIIIFTKKASAAYRYNLLIGALTLFALGVTATFIGQLRKPAANGAAYEHYSITPRTSTIQTTAAHPISTIPVHENIADTVISYFNTHYNIIVLIWFLIICAKSVQMAVGLYSVYYLKRTKVIKVAEDWENRLLQLAKQLHIEQAIRLMESGIAKAPMVVGHLKPVILIPIGLINSLTTKEVEAILLHELAHVRRRDYLVNLMQSFTEIAFFFNPAVLWISQLIKTERENCCDDLAIAQSRNKENYIRALVSCEQYQAAGAAYGMAFPGAKNSLRHRVTRLVRNRNYSLGFFEKTILAASLVVMGLGISAFTVRQNITEALTSVAAVIQHDSNTKHKEKVKVDKNNTTVNKWSPPVNKRAAQLSQVRHPALSATDTVIEPGTADAALALWAKQDTNKTASETSRAIALGLYREHPLMDTNLPYGSSHPGPNDVYLQERIRESNEIRRRIVDEYLRQGKSYTFRDSGSYADQNNYLSEAYRYRNLDTSYQSIGDEAKRAQAEIDKKLVADLLQDGLITDPKNVSFSLSDKQIIVNGKKQSDEVYRKYKEKYMPGVAGSGWGWTYSHH